MAERSSICAAADLCASRCGMGKTRALQLIRAGLVAGFLTLPAVSGAVPITYQLTGILTGSLGTTSFTDARVDFTFTGDTAYVVDASTINSALAAGYAALNTDPNAVATVSVHLPDGSIQSAQFTQTMYWTADYYNIGVGISAWAYGPTYPFSMHMGTGFTISSDSPPLAGSPFSCTNFSPSTPPTCAAPAAVSTSAGNLIITGLQSGCPNTYIGVSPVPCQTETAYVASTGANVFITFTGDGAGSVSGTPGSVSCTATCTTTVAAGTPVTLTATPQAGSVFAGWSGPCLGTATTCVLPMNGLANVGATFKQAAVATAVTVNNLAACAETAGSTIECWGTVAGGFKIAGPGTYDGDAESPIPAEFASFGNNALAVSVGESWNNCALLAGGAVQCWPASSSSGPAPTPVAGLTSGIAAVSAGSAHSCALTTAGAVECWGDNTYGELGDGTTTSSATPVAVVGLPPIVTAIAAGGGADPIDRGLRWAHSCAVASDGTVWCWGSNSFGQLGNGAFSGTSSRPVQVLGLTAPAIAISAGEISTCALTTSGAAACWGGGFYDNFRQFGYATAVALPGVDSGVVGVAAGSDHDCAVSGDGTVRCWGDNIYGELGNGTTNSSPSAPVVVTGLPADIVGVAAGGAAFLGGTIERDGNDSCALTSTGAIWCWGDNSAGQLGAITTAVTSPTPVQVMGFGSTAPGQPTPNRILFTNPPGPPAPLASATAGGASLTLAAAALSGDTPRFASLTPDRCTISGATANFFAPGVCMVTVTDAGNGTYAPAPPQSRTIIVQPGTTSATSVALAANANPGLVGSPVSFTATVTGKTPTGSVAFYDTGLMLAGCGAGGTVPLVGAMAVCNLPTLAPGTHAITAAYSGDALNPGSTSVVLKEAILNAQTITFPAIGPQNLSAGAFAITASASSGLPVTVATSTPSVCSVNGFTVTPLMGGTCTLVATQAGNATYAPAPPVTQSFNIQGVSQQPQTIHFPPIGPHKLAERRIDVRVSASSGLPVTLSTLTGDVCAVDGTTIELLEVGRCTIAANQAGNTQYLPAPEVRRSFRIEHRRRHHDE